MYYVVNKTSGALVYRTRSLRRAQAWEGYVVMDEWGVFA